MFPTSSLIDYSVLRTRWARRPMCRAGVVSVSATVTSANNSKLIVRIVPSHLFLDPSLWSRNMHGFISAWQSILIQHRAWVDTYLFRKVMMTALDYLFPRENLLNLDQSSEEHRSTRRYCHDTGHKNTISNHFSYSERRLKRTHSRPWDKWRWGIRKRDQDWFQLKDARLHDREFTANPGFEVIGMPALTMHRVLRGHRIESSTSPALLILDWRKVQSWHEYWGQSRFL